MNAENFCYWLQGYIEIEEADAPCEALSQNQVRSIKEHLALVFKKVTSSPQGLSSNPHDWMSGIGLARGVGGAQLC